MNISEVQRKMLQQECLLRCDLTKIGFIFFVCTLHQLVFLLIMILQVNYDFFNRVKLRMSFFDSEKL